MKLCSFWAWFGFDGRLYLNPEQSAQSSNLLGNESEINLEVQEPMDEISKSVSEAKIKRVTPLSDSQPSNQFADQFWPLLSALKAR